MRRVLPAIGLYFTPTPQEQAGRITNDAKARSEII
jgi:hypothetical protein